MGNIFDFGTTKDEKVLANYLKIGGNRLEYNESFIPLTSISQISCMEKTGESSPLASWLLALGGVLCIGVKNWFVIITGIALLFVAGVILYEAYKMSRKSLYYLVISLNSGRSIYLPV